MILVLNMWNLLAESWRLINEVWAALTLAGLVIIVPVFVAISLSSKQRAIRKTKRALKRAQFRAKPRFARMLLRIGHIWVLLVVVVNVGAIVGTFLESKSFLDGVTAAADLYSPYTISTYMINVALLAPFFVTTAWADRVESRTNSKTAHTTSSPSP